MPAKFSIHWEGIAQLRETYKACGVVLDDKNPQVKDILYPPCSAAIENARNLAPLGHVTTRKHKPGTLRRSLLVTRGPATQRGVFMVARGKIAPYARFVEYGTSKTAAHPFFRPAMLAFGSTYVAAVAPGVKSLLEKTAASKAFHPSA